jgi:hypothetical protein
MAGVLPRDGMPVTWLLALPVIWITWRWYLLIDRWWHEFRQWRHRRSGTKAHHAWLAMGYAEVRPGEYVRTGDLNAHQRLENSKLRWRTLCRGERELRR